MYSWEIKELLEKSNYIIDSDTYTYILDTSPQIAHIEYNPYQDSYKIWDNQNNFWKLKVYYKK